MNSRIDDILTPTEKQVLQLYRSGKHSGIRRAARLTVQYAIGTGLFVWLCISKQQPYWCLVVYGVFILFMIIRLIGARRLAGVMPGIIEKYETRIATLEAQIRASD
jgi:hypothetical protein